MLLPLTGMYNGYKHREAQILFIGIKIAHQHLSLLQYSVAGYQKLPLSHKGLTQWSAESYESESGSCVRLTYMDPIAVKGLKSFKQLPY